MEVAQVLQSRRSIKSFTTKPVSRDDLIKLVGLARSSPSGANKNPWRFIIVTETDILQQLSQAHNNCKWLAGAPAGIAIAADPASTRYWLEDCSVAAYSIWLAATDLGLGVAWAAMYLSDNPEESNRRQNFVKEKLAIPDNWSVPMVLAVGYPDGSPLRERARPALDEVAFWERYRKAA